MRCSQIIDDIVQEPVQGRRKALLRILDIDRSFIRAEGDYLFDAAGLAVYDGSAQYGTNIFGHNDQGVQRAATSYLTAGEPTFLQPFRNAAQDRLAKQLTTSTKHMQFCTFANSGAEAVEAAIKLARCSTRRKSIISLRNGFHGKTQLSLAVSGSERFSHPLICDRTDTSVIAVGDIEAFRKRVDQHDVAAFIFEPIMGEGGMLAPDAEFLRNAIEAARTCGTMVIADEVQCGLLRCGGILVSDVLGFDVDIALLGKGLGGGIIPISAVLYRQEARSREFDRLHSSTFAGGGLACAVASHVMERLTSDETLASCVEGLSARIDQQADWLQDRIRVTGRGLMRGIYFKGVDGTGNCGLNFFNNSGLLGNLVSAWLLHKHNVISLPLLSQPCALRFEPALNTTIEAVDRFFEAISDVSEIISNGRYDILLSPFVGRPEETLPERGIVISPYNHDDVRSHTMIAPNEDGQAFDFAFLTHLTQPSDISGMFPRAIREHFSESEITRLVRLVEVVGRLDPTPSILLSFEIEGSVVSRRGLLLSSLLYPRDLLRLPAIERDFLIDSYMHKARSLGVKVVGLGAYTSIITKGGIRAADRFPDICITTGNTLTAAATAAQLRELAGDGRSTIAIVGARGSVGSLIALSAACHADRLILVGRQYTSVASYRSLLVRLFRELLTLQNILSGSVADKVHSILRSDATESEIDAAITKLVSDDPLRGVISITGDHRSGLSEAKFVVSCTSEGKPFLSSDYVRPDAIILDAARPFDFARTANKELPILIESGLVRQPSMRRYGDNNLLVEETGMALGCLSETVILSMDNRIDNFMINVEPSLLALVEVEILAQRHGFYLNRMTNLVADQGLYDRVAYF